MIRGCAGHLLHGVLKVILLGRAQVALDDPGQGDRPRLRGVPLTDLNAGHFEGVQQGWESLVDGGAERQIRGDDALAAA